jgi:collagenase-like PrtC family protease
LEEYNVHRIILPREVTLKEIKTLTSKFPNVEFEVFLS